MEESEWRCCVRVQHPLLGTLSVSISWHSTRIVRQPTSVKLVDYSPEYLWRRLLTKQEGGIVRGKCLLKLSDAGPNYIMMTLSENSKILNINYHQVLAYLNWGVTSGWYSEEYFVVII